MDQLDKKVFEVKVLGQEATLVKKEELSKYINDKYNELLREVE